MNYRHFSDRHTFNIEFHQEYWLYYSPSPLAPWWVIFFLSSLVASLFSSFDPSSYSRVLSFSTPLIVTVFLYSSLYTFSSPISSIAYRVYSRLSNSLGLLVYSPGYLGCLPLYLGVFILVLTANSLGLLPYVFTPTRFIRFTLGLCLSFWVTFTVYAWCTMPGVSLMATVPLGTPPILIPFIVLIESIRLFIRPVTLSVRLAANIVAGHCLLRLAGSGFRRVLRFFPAFLFQSALMVLELAVAAIQSFVLVVLLTLYSKGTFMDITLPM